MRSIVASSLFLLLSGCNVLEPREDATRTFILSATPGAATPSPSTEVPLVVSVGPVRLPDYLLRPEIVRRAGENQLDPSAVDRWAEPIDRAFLRILCLDLAARMPRSRVVAFPPLASGDAVQVELDVAGFEGTPAGEVRLDARWSLRDVRTGNHIVRGSDLARAASNGETPAVVAAMSGLIGELADEIARELAVPR